MRVKCLTQGHNAQPEKPLWVCHVNQSSTHHSRQSLTCLLKQTRRLIHSVTGATSSRGQGPLNYGNSLFNLYTTKRILTYDPRYQVDNFVIFVGWSSDQSSAVVYVGFFTGLRSRFKNCPAQAPVLFNCISSRSKPPESAPALGPAPAQFIAKNSKTSGSGPGSSALFFFQGGGTTSEGRMGQGGLGRCLQK